MAKVPIRSLILFVMCLNFREMQSLHVTCLRQTTEHCSFLIRLRCYPTYYMISSLFNINRNNGERGTIISYRVISCVLLSIISWPAISEWRQMPHVWQKLSSAIGTTDGTSFLKYTDQTEPK